MHHIRLNNAAQADIMWWCLFMKKLNGNTTGHAMVFIKYYSVACYIRLMEVQDTMATVMVQPSLPPQQWLKYSTAPPAETTISCT